MSNGLHRDVLISFQQIEMDEFVLHPFFLSVIIISFIYILKKWIILSKSCSKRTLLVLPPSPRKLPILGNLHQLRPLAHRLFESLGRKYGPVMLLHFGRRPVIIFQSADGAKEVVNTHDLVFANRPETRVTKRLLYDSKDISIAPYGEYWRKLKSICVLQLLSNKRVHSFQYIREEETTLVMKKIKSCSGSSSAPVNLSQLFMTLSNDIICRSAFGKKYSQEEDGNKFLSLITELMQLLGSFSFRDYIPSLSWMDRASGFDARVARVAKGIDDFLDHVIQEHLNYDDTDSVKLGETRRETTFIKILLKINSEDVSIDKDSIKAIILDVFVGGTDTASATLAWAMTELLRHPIVMNKLQKEIREILRDKHDVTDEDLEKMHYLKAVVKETLRYHTPIPFLSREAREDVKVMGYDIAAGTMILVNAWAIGRDPASWDEPEKFKPERFLINSSIDFMGLDFELVPFGAGRRRCPGIASSMANVELVLANLLQKFEWGLPQGIKPEDLDTTENPGGIIHRKNPLFAVATHCYF
ncbi:hypothetical protein ACJIZ3_006438 [Penstemon smallii]|uniref:Cytochrome P450 n=1 Tax=Penstemon smallii TaxID=265156 RepID=A0ABD3S7V3_9LAMI